MDSHLIAPMTGESESEREAIIKVPPRICSRVYEGEFINEDAWVNWTLQVTVHCSPYRLTLLSSSCRPCDLPFLLLLYF